MPEYFVISNLAVEREKTMPHRKAHLDYLTKLKEDGKLRMAGRFSNGNGGLYILITESYEEAEELTKADPYHSSDLRQYTIIEWERRL